jgi:metal-responsive CopG/Arc/MetJ family transcriptional regulator
MAKSRTFNVRLPEDLVAWLDDRARRERRSRNQLIKIILEDARAALPTEQPSRIENEQPKTLPPQIRLRRAY